MKVIAVVLAIALVNGCALTEGVQDLRGPLTENGCRISFFAYDLDKVRGVVYRRDGECK